MRVVPLMAALVTCLAAQDAKDYSDAYQAGQSMKRSAALELEEKVSNRPADLIARARLIGFYTLSNEIDSAQAITAR